MSLVEQMGPGVEVVVCSVVGSGVGNTVVVGTVERPLVAMVVVDCQTVVVRNLVSHETGPETMVIRKLGRSSILWPIVPRIDYIE